MLKLPEREIVSNTITHKSIFKGSLKNTPVTHSMIRVLALILQHGKIKCNWPTDCLVCLVHIVHTTYYPTCLHSLYVLEVWLAMAFGCRSRLVEKDDSFFLYSQMNYLHSDFGVWLFKLCLWILICHHFRRILCSDFRFFLKFKGFREQTLLKNFPALLYVVFLILTYFIYFTFLISFYFSFKDFFREFW